MDFYELASVKAKELSKTEQELLQYAVKNLHIMKKISIREFASRCFVSTATVFRFVKKMGFEGYSDFQSMIEETEKESRNSNIPMALKRGDYRDAYIKNIVEAVNVISTEKAEEFRRLLIHNPNIFILAEGLSKEVAYYIYRVLTVAGYKAMVPEHDYERKAMIQKITQDDMILALSFTGDSEMLIRNINEVMAVSTPKLVSFTRADNNVLQNMSDLNFYFFADQLTYDGMDITSHCGMLAIFETLIYPLIGEK